MMRTLFTHLMLLVVLPPALPFRRDERGLSQSTENAILLAGAAALATTVILVIKGYVEQRLPR